MSYLKRITVATGLLLGCWVSSAVAKPEAKPLSDGGAVTFSEVIAAAEMPESVDATTSETRLVLSIEARQVFLFRGETLVTSYPVAVGAAETPTALGQFVVSQMVIDPLWQSPWTGEVHEPGPDSALGLRWIGFATTEEGSFGFHGTPTVESIGQAASNGCVRMSNEDVVALFDQVQVGTPVFVIQ